MLLEFELIPHYIRGADDVNSDLPAEDTIPTYSPSNLADDHTHYSSDLHDPLLGSTLPSIEEDYDRSISAAASGDHTSQELHSLQHLDDPATPTSLHMGAEGGPSQELEMVNAPWHSQNSGSQSQEPTSPHLRKTSDWPTSLDTGYGSKSQDSYTQSQPKSQETFHPSGAGELAFTPPSGGSGGHAPPSPPQERGEELAAHHHLQQHHTPYPPPPTHHQHHQQHQRPPHIRTHSSEFGSPKNSVGDAHTPSHTHHPHQQHPQGGKGKEGLKPLTTSSGYGGYDDSSRYHHHSQDAYSPSQPPHFAPPLGGGAAGMDYSPLSRSFDPYHGGFGGGYGGGYPLPSVDEGGGAFDKSGYAVAEHFKRRTMTYGGRPGPGGMSEGMFGSPYGTIPPSRHMMGGHYPGTRPGFPPPPEMYDPRAGPHGRYARPLDPMHYPGGPMHSHFGHALSLEKLDRTPPSTAGGPPGGVRSRHHPMMGRGGGGAEDEGAGVHMDMFLSQPTTGYFSYEQPPAGFGMPMMG